MNKVNQNFLFRKRMKIYFKIPSKKTISLEVSAEDTIQSTKEKILESEELSFEDCKLIFAGKYLEPEKALKDYGICNDCFLIVLPPDNTRMKILVKNIHGHITNLEVENSYSIADLKSKLEEVEGIPADQQRYVFNQMQLKDKGFRNLEECGIRNGDTVNLLLRLG